MNELHDDADQIEAVLTRYQVPARVQGGSVNEHTTRFYLWLGGSVAATTACVDALRDEIARVLGRASCLLGRQGRTLFLEVPRLPPPSAALSMRDHAARNALPPTDSALLGLTDDDQPLFVRFPSDEVGHLLLCGMAGTGKSALMRAMALSLAEANHPRRWRLVLLDSRAGLRPLAALPHTWGHATTVEASVGWLVRLSSELDRRLTLRAESVTPPDPSPRLLVLIDHAAPLLQVGGTAVRLALAQLLAKGRTVGIHLVAATTRPDALGTLARAFPLKLIGQTEGVAHSVVAQWIQAGAVQQLGRGEFFALAPTGIGWHFRAAWASPGDVMMEVRRQRQGRERVVARQAPIALPPPVPTREASAPIPRRAHSCRT